MLTLQAAGNELQVIRDGEAAFAVHPLWLRERCADAASLDQRTQQRLFNPSALDPALSITEVTDHEDGWIISFSDGAASHFSKADLLAEWPAANEQTLPTPIAWASTNEAPRPVDWTHMHNDAVRLASVQDFLVHGYVIIDNVPPSSGSVLDVGRAFGFPRETNFGVMFDVRSEPDANDLAYTSLHLDPHTDNPYRAPVPGIQLLHCLANEAEGGLSTLVDGMAVGQALAEEAPDLFACLTTTLVRFRYVDRATELIASAPLMSCDAAGQVCGLHYSPRLDFVPLLPPDSLALFYAARRKLDQMLTSSTYERRFKLDKGQCMMFDNFRLLHGRTSFDPRTGYRHLQGCYIDSDGPRSLYRILRKGIA